MRVISHRFKIEAINDWVYKYGLFERKTFLGFDYWSLAHKSNYVENLIDRVEDLRKLPRYFD